MKGIVDLLEGRPGPAARALLEARGVDPGSDDDLAAEAYEIFGRGVFPYAGVFLDDDGGARRPLAEQLEAPTAETATWLPAFIRALRDLERPVASAVADALEAVDTPPSPVPVVGPPPPDPAAPETDLRAIAHHLCSAARCGVFLSAPVIERIGREAGVPRGFGPRRRILEELLRAAGRYDRLDAVLGGLAAVVDRHASADPRAAATGRWLSRLRSALL